MERTSELTKVCGQLFHLKRGGRCFELFDLGREGAIMPEEREEYMAKYASPIEHALGKPMWEFDELDEAQSEAYSINDIHRDLSLAELKYRVPCKVCKNKGFVAFVSHGSVAVRDCECLKKKGVKSEEYGLLSRCTFENYRIGKDWQKDALRRAKRWTLQNKFPVLYLGGKAGTGKTHLATAAYGAMLKRGRRGEYISWREASRGLKMRMRDYDGFYEPRINAMKTVPVLFMDDVLWTQNGGIASDEDFRIFKEIIEARIQRRLPTIITCRFTPEELYGLTAEIGGRIYEACGSRNNFAVCFNAATTDWRMREIPVAEASQEDYTLFDVAGGTK